jgi:hypothetical protein
MTTWTSEVWCGTVRCSIALADRRGCGRVRSRTRPRQPLSGSRDRDRPDSVGGTFSTPLGVTPLDEALVDGWHSVLASGRLRALRRGRVREPRAKRSLVWPLRAPRSERVLLCDRSSRNRRCAGVDFRYRPSPGSGGSCRRHGRRDRGVWDRAGGACQPHPRACDVGRNAHVDRSRVPRSAYAAAIGRWRPLACVASRLACRQWTPPR